MTFADMKLGLKPREERDVLKLAPSLTGVVPDHPAAADHFSTISRWMLGGNDKFGTCGPTSNANLTVLIKKCLAGLDVTVTDDAIFDLYRHAGNPDFDPTTDTDDNGVDLQTLLTAWVKYGLVVTHADGQIENVKPIAFAQVDHTNLDEIRAAIAIFGAGIFGVDLDTAQQAQSDAGGPWDYKKSPSWGGHAIMAGRYTSVGVGTDISSITWAEIMGMTDAFVKKQLSQCFIVVFEEHLTDPGFIAGINVDQFGADYTALTGDPSPFRPTPTPEPNPAPGPVDDVDMALVDGLTPWLGAHHVGINADAAHRVLTWMGAKGYAPGSAGTAVHDGVNMVSESVPGAAE